MLSSHWWWPQVAKAADARSYWGAIMPDVVANHDAEVSTASPHLRHLLKVLCYTGSSYVKAEERLL